MKKLTLFVTNMCNKKCYYCDIPKLTHTRHFNIEESEWILQHIEKLKINRLVITGGEPGLLSLEHIKILSSYFRNKSLQISTNGTFIKNKYQKYFNHIDILQLHSEITFKKEIESYNNINLNKVFFYSINKTNLKNLEDWLEINKNIIIELVPYDDKNNQSHLKLNLNDIKFINKIIQKRINVSENSKNTFRVLEKFYDQHDVFKKLCFSKNYNLLIDLVNHKINKCICSNSRSSSVDLTLENLKNLKNLKFNESSMCNDCLFCIKEYKNYMGKEI